MHVDFRAGRQDRRENKVASSHLQPPEGEGLPLDPPDRPAHGARHPV